MAKSKNIFVCQNCGSSASKWMGRCQECGEWNTFVEEIVRKESPRSNVFIATERSVPRKLSEIQQSDIERINTKNEEFNRVLGGGIVPGSIVLIGGEPGIGKSTLALQIALDMKGINTLYVSGEESQQQIKMRATRFGKDNDKCLILNETSLENILLELNKNLPELLIIDSIQTLHTESLESAAGSVSQVRECCQKLQVFAKQKTVPVILIGHINKDGNIAGPKVLEHIVDTVLQFEGDQHYLYRILRSVKNRFGSTSELGIFEMLSEGLKEVLNPSEILLSHTDENMSGIAVASSINGIRPFLIEIQALASSAAYGTPQRSSTGFDSRRLNMLLAVLEKRAGFKIATKDVFLNIAGGIKVADPAIDLAIICAVLSSAADIPVNKNACFCAEISLSGEVRPVNRIEQRIAEAHKLGFTNIYVSKYNMKGIKIPGSVNIVTLTKVEDIVKKIFS